MPLGHFDISKLCRYPNFGYYPGFEIVSVFHSIAQTIWRLQIVILIFIKMYGNRPTNSSDSW